MKFLKVALLMLGMLGLTNAAMAAGKVEIRNAWIPQAPPVARVMAGYFEIDNNGSKPVTIVGASCADFGSVMMHKTVEVNGMSRMVHLPSLKVGPHSKATFHRGGMHLMLMQPKHTFKVGDKVAITLMTSDKHKIDFMAVVKPADFDSN